MSLVLWWSEHQSGRVSPGREPWRRGKMAVTAAHTMRKFLNDPGQVTSDFLDGLASAHPDLLCYDRERRIVVRRDAPVEGKVGLVSAGGTGVEPLHGGFVGLGMLDAACPGEIFTSPNPDQIMAATRV